MIFRTYEKSMIIRASCRTLTKLCPQNILFTCNIKWKFFRAMIFNLGFEGLEYDHLEDLQLFHCLNTTT